MKFNNALFAFLYGCIFSVLITSCASNTEKKAVNAEPSITDNKAVVVPSALPAGPITPNPYLQTKPAINAAAEANFQAAVTAMQQKQWAQAETLLQKLAAENPKLSGVYLNLGIVARAKGNSEKVAELFEQAIKVNSKNLDAYNQLAILKREAGKFSDAEALYQQALNVWPFHTDSHKNIAILYELYMGKPEQALPHYLAYQQLLPAPDKQVDSWIADLQRRLNGGKKASADADKNDQAAEAK